MWCDLLILNTIFRTLIVVVHMKSTYKLEFCVNMQCIYLLCHITLYIDDFLKINLFCSIQANPRVYVIFTVE